MAFSPPSAATGTTTNHYESHTSSSYESAYFYSPGVYTAYLADLVRKRLGIKPDVSSGRLVDVGGGTGNFTRMLVEDVGGMDAVVIDPFLAEDETDVDGGGGDESAEKRKIHFVKAGAETFAIHTEDAGGNDEAPWWRSGYHQCLLKEVVHHLNASEREGIFRGIRYGLLDSDAVSPTSPSILIITRPQRDIDYPLWGEAREVWASNQPPVEDIEADLIKAGFRNVGHTIESYRCETTLDRWLGMVKGRFWSTFSNFTEEELEDGCRLIAEDVNINEKGGIAFDDKLLFITATK